MVALEMGQIAAIKWQRVIYAEGAASFVQDDFNKAIILILL